MEKKEQIIMRDSKFPTMMQQQEEDEVQKLTEKEHRDMASKPAGEALLLAHHVLSFHYLI